MNTLDQSPLGKTTTYDHYYDPTLLVAIERMEQRRSLGIDAVLPFTGEDIWNGYELSWLNEQGKPQVAMAEFRFPATSPCLIESKSFKLYLNSFADERLSQEALLAHLRKDLSALAGAPVAVCLVPSSEFVRTHCLASATGVVIDELDVAIDHYGPPEPAFLTAHEQAPVEEVLVSHLLKSNCPVTGQPDWGSVQVAYVGKPIDREGLLRYLVSFRHHNAFHEHCLERIFTDIQHRCRPQQLSVYARYTRRGGLDINPFRSTEKGVDPVNQRTPRQ